MDENYFRWRLNRLKSIQAFTKILNHYDRLKSQALIVHQEAVNDFERSAEKLYALLKQKEVVEREFNANLSTTQMVMTLSNHHRFLEQIHHKIKFIQMEVNQKRAVMEKKKEKLTEAHVEVKKYEKLIENKQKIKAELVKYYDNQAMDEIAMRQFYKQRSI